MTFTTKVWCSFSAIGFHSWPNAPENVSYLRQTHRHAFRFKVTVLVPHPDRSIEFHTLRAKVQRSMMNSSTSFGIMRNVVEKDVAWDFGNSSCEMIAKELLDILVEDYPDRQISVEVSEDGENGGIVEYKSPGEQNI